MSGYPTVDTFDSLVDEVIVSLQGFGVEVDQIATLVTDIGPLSNSLRLDMSDAVTRGIIEIDQELMFVSSAVDGVAVVPPWGRGFKGTAAASHTAGSAVYVSPTFPRSIVTREINNTIQSVYPMLFAVRGYDFTTDAIHVQYSAPVDMDRIINATWRWLVTDGWKPLEEFQLVSGANSTDYPTGKYIAIGANLASGIKVHITYAAPPTLLTNPTDSYSTVTGLPASSRDVIVYGTAARLVPWLDTGRLPVETVAADMQDQAKPIGNAISVGRELRQLYTTRLEQERLALANRYPYRQHRIR